MEELKKRILLLNLQPKDAPGRIPVQTFGNWLRAVKNNGDVSPIAECVLELLCDKLENQNSK